MSIPTGSESTAVVVVAGASFFLVFVPVCGAGVGVVGVWLLPPLMLKIDDGVGVPGLSNGYSLVFVGVLISIAARARRLGGDVILMGSPFSAVTGGSIFGSGFLSGMHPKRLLGLWIPSPPLPTVGTFNPLPVLALGRKEGILLTTFSGPFVFTFIASGDGESIVVLFFFGEANVVFGVVKFLMLELGLCIAVGGRKDDLFGVAIVVVVGGCVCLGSRFGLSGERK